MIRKMIFYPFIARSTVSSRIVPHILSHGNVLTARQAAISFVISAGHGHVLNTNLKNVLDKGSNSSQYLAMK
jgi:hypothetical protein